MNDKQIYLLIGGMVGIVIANILRIIIAITPMIWDMFRDWIVYEFDL